VFAGGAVERRRSIRRVSGNRSFAMRVRVGEVGEADEGVRTLGYR